MDKISILVLGAGFFGENWLRELSACTECEVAGVVAKHPDLLAAVGDEFKIPVSRRFATIADGLDGSKADAVVVAPQADGRPDPELLLAERHSVADGPRVADEEPRERVVVAERRDSVRAHPSAPRSCCSPR